MTTAPAKVPSRRNAELRSFAELFLLSGFAFAEPLLQIFGGDPSVFGQYGVLGMQIVMWALVVLLAPPLLAWCLEVVVGAFSQPARRWLHLGLLTVAMGFWAVRVARATIGFRGLLAVLVAVALAAGFAVGYRRVPVIRKAMLYLCVAPLLFFFTFVTSPGMWTLISSGSSVDVAAATDEHGATSEAGEDASGEHRGGPGTVPVEIAPVGSVDSDIPIVFVIFDGLPTWALLDGQGNIDASLYPNFATLAQSSTWYRNSTTVAPNTTRAVPAILSGKVGDPWSAPIFDASHHPETIFTWLGGSYEMNVVEPVGQICPINICEVESARFAEIFRETWRQWRLAVSPSLTDNGDDIISTEDRVAAFSAWLDDLKGGATLNFFHILMPHDPVDVNEDLHRYDGPMYPDGRTSGIWSSSEAAMMGRQRFMLQVQAADRLLGELIDRMKSLGLWDTSALVVTADHGSSFIAGQAQRGLDTDNLQELVWQLTMVRTPGQAAGAVSDQQVRTVDIVPTLADVLGSPVPWETDGVSMLDPDRPTLATLPVISRWTWNEVGKKQDFIDVDPTLYEQVLEMRAAPDPSPPDEFTMYRMGEYGGLVGQSVDDLDTLAVPVTGELVEAGRWDDVDLEADTLPLYISGTFEGSPLRQIAVAVNGKIALTAPAGEGLFWGVLASDFFVDGENDVQPYLVSGPANRPILTPIGDG